jgi:putative transposase
MPNHVHWILVPSDEGGLSRAVGETHRRYSGYITARLRVTGHLFQGRFGCAAMDESHLIAAFRYVALNPVKAKLAATAADWRWSSARAHLRRQDDGLVTVRALLDRIENFAEFLEVPTDPERVAALSKGHTIGRPLMGDQALAELEKRLGRPLPPGKRGRPPSQKHDARQRKLV